MKRTALRGSLLAAVLAVGLFGQAAGAVTLDDRRSLRFEDVSLTGTAGSTALSLRIATTSLTVAQAAGESQFQASRKVTTTPAIADNVAAEGLAPCDHPQAVRIAGASQCFRSAYLEGRGVAVPTGQSPVLELKPLVDAGIITLQTSPQVDTITGEQAKSAVSGLLVPSLSTAQAKCDQATPKSEVTTVPIPAQLAPVIAGNLAYVRCTTTTSGLPSLTQDSGEAILDLTLTQTLVKSVPQLNQAIDSLQQTIQPLPEQVRTPVNTALDTIQQRLSAQPVAKVRVAPNSGQIVSTAKGMAATSVARGATIDLLPLENLPIGQLDGIAQITVGEALSAASVENGTANASNQASVVRVKVLNLLTPDPNDVLLDLPVSPGTDVTILENTPLQSTIRIARAPAPLKECKQAGGGLVDCRAAAEAQSLLVSLFDPTLRNGTANPLPNVTLELASSNASVAGQFKSGQTQPQLPVTGAGSLPSVLAGAGLVTLAVLVRRRLLA